MDSRLRSSIHDVARSARRVLTADVQALLEGVYGLRADSVKVRLETLTGLPELAAHAAAREARLSTRWWTRWYTA